MSEDSTWLKQVIDSIGEAVVAVDMRGVIVTINPEARRILDVTAGTPLAPRLCSASGDPLADEEQPIARVSLEQQTGHTKEDDGDGGVEIAVRDPWVGQHQPDGDHRDTG